MFLFSGQEQIARGKPKYLDLRIKTASSNLQISRVRMRRPSPTKRPRRRRKQKKSLSCVSNSRLRQHFIFKKVHQPGVRSRTLISSFKGLTISKVNYCSKKNTPEPEPLSHNLIVKLLESEIQEARSKKDTFKAHSQSARSATKVSEMVGNVHTSSALSAFYKMEEKVLAMESQAEALGQLNTDTDDLEGKVESSSVGDANLKKELSGSSKNGA